MAMALLLQCKLDLYSKQCCLKEDEEVTSPDKSNWTIVLLLTDYCDIIVNLTLAKYTSANCLDSSVW